MKKQITLYQAATEESFTKNMMARFSKDYASMDEMEAVVMPHMEGEDTAILDRCFILFNQKEYRYSLNYSMSVGDVVAIGKALYRCSPIGLHHSRQFALGESQNIGYPTSQSIGAQSRTVQRRFGKSWSSRHCRSDFAGLKQSADNAKADSKSNATYQQSRFPGSKNLRHPW